MGKKGFKAFWAVVLVVVLLAGCAPLVSETLRRKAVDVPFERVAAEPARFIGEHFIWGGTIITAKQMEKGTELEVMQNPLDSRGYIKEKDISGGRFLVQTQRLLDPLIYRAGRGVTAAGRLVEYREGSIGQMPYTYPVLSADELYLLKDGSGVRVVPSVFIGVGGRF